MYVVWSLLARFFAWLSMSAYCWHHDCIKRAKRALRLMNRHRVKRARQCHEFKSNNTLLPTPTRSSVVPTCELTEEEKSSILQAQQEMDTWSKAKAETGLKMAGDSHADG